MARLLVVPDLFAESFLVLIWYLRVLAGLLFGNNELDWFLHTSVTDGEQSFMVRN